jgi:hypothetical protein
MSAKEARMSCWIGMVDVEVVLERKSAHLGAWASMAVCLPEQLLRIGVGRLVAGGSGI